MDTLAWGVTSPLAVPPDMEIVARVRAGDSALFEILMRRHNQRVYRVVRAIVKDETDVEDVMPQPSTHSRISINSRSGRSSPHG